MRIEPPPSLACAIGTMPAATAAAEPPDEPPGVRDGSHGLRVGAEARASRSRAGCPTPAASSCPTTTKPAALQAARRRCGRGRPEVADEVGARTSARRPATAAVVLDGDRHAGERPLVAGADAVGLGQRLVGEDVDERVERGLSSSMRSSEACTSSRADSSPERTSAASSSTGRNRRSAAAALDMRRPTGRSRATRPAPTRGPPTFSSMRSSSSRRRSRSRRRGPRAGGRREPPRRRAARGTPARPRRQLDALDAAVLGQALAADQSRALHPVQVVGEGRPLDPDRLGELALGLGPL